MEKKEKSKTTFYQTLFKGGWAEIGRRKYLKKQKRRHSATPSFSFN